MDSAILSLGAVIGAILGVLIAIYRFMHAR